MIASLMSFGPGELWRQAGGGTPDYSRERYHELLTEHGHLVPLKPGEKREPLPCGWPDWRVDDGTWPTVAATGHRPQHLKPDERRWVRGELARIVTKLRDHFKMRTGISGMALGTDLWWAAELVAADVALWAHIPFPQQPDPWSEADRAEWRRLYARSARVTWYGDHYSVRLLHERNDGMLAAADAIVAVHKRSKTTGGTASAVAKAERLGLPIIRLDPEQRSAVMSGGTP